MCYMLCCCKHCDMSGGGVMGVLRLPAPLAQGHTWCGTCKVLINRVVRGADGHEAMAIVTIIMLCGVCCVDHGLPEPCRVLHIGKRLRSDRTPKSAPSDAAVSEAAHQCIGPESKHTPG